MVKKLFIAYEQSTMRESQEDVYFASTSSV